MPLEGAPGPVLRVRCGHRPCRDPDGRPLQWQGPGPRPQVRGGSSDTSRHAPRYRSSPALRPAADAGLVVRSAPFRFPL